jgi:hypothetical protein
MKLRFFISLTAGSFFLLVMMVSCYSHRRPVSIRNDSGEAVRLDISPYKQIEEPRGSSIDIGEGVRVPGCSKHWEFIYLSTQSHRDFVAYRVKDICDIDDCACDVKVSDLERRRHDLSVPWAKAGIVFPPGAQR